MAKAEKYYDPILEIWLQEQIVIPAIDIALLVDRLPASNETLASLVVDPSSSPRQLEQITLLDGA